MMKKYYPEACFLKEIFQGIQISYLETDSLQPMVGKRSKTESKLRWPEFWFQKSKIHDSIWPYRETFVECFSGVKLSTKSNGSIFWTQKWLLHLVRGGFLQIVINFFYYLVSIFEFSERKTEIYCINVIVSVRWSQNVQFYFKKVLRMCCFYLNFMWRKTLFFRKNITCRG